MEWLLMTINCCSLGAMVSEALLAAISLGTNSTLITEAGFKTYMSTTCRKVIITLEHAGRAKGNRLINAGV